MAPPPPARAAVPAAPPPPPVAVASPAPAGGGPASPTSAAAAAAANAASAAAGVVARVAPELGEEIRAEVRAVVALAVTEALAPLGHWQRDLEARVAAAERARPVPAADAAANPFLTPAVPTASPSEPRRWPPKSVPPPPVAPKPIDMNAGPMIVELPDMLDAGRKRRRLGWIVGIVAFLIVAGMFVAMAISQSQPR